MYYVGKYILTTNHNNERMDSMDVEEERLLDERIKEYGITMLYDKKMGNIFP